MTDTLTKEQGTQTPLNDLVAAAIDRMNAGARMTLSDIPGDASLSSSSHPGEVSIAIAALVERGLAVTPRPISEVPKGTADNFDAIIWGGTIEHSASEFSEPHSGPTCATWSGSKQRWERSDSSSGYEEYYIYENPAFYLPLSSLPKVTHDTETK